MFLYSGKISIFVSAHHLEPDTINTLLIRAVLVVYAGYDGLAAADLAGDVLSHPVDGVGSMSPPSSPSTTEVGSVVNDK